MLFSISYLLMFFGISVSLRNALKKQQSDKLKKELTKDSVQLKASMSLGQEQSNEAPWIESHLIQNEDDDNDIRPTSGYSDCTLFIDSNQIDHIGGEEDFKLMKSNSKFFSLPK